MRIFCAFPLVGYVMLVLLACLAAFNVGHWPYYAHPDPSELGLIAPFVIAVSLLSLISIPVLALSGLVVWLVKRRARVKFSLTRPMMGLYLAGVLVWGAEWMRFAAGAGLIEWAID